MPGTVGAASTHAPSAFKYAVILIVRWLLYLGYFALHPVSRRTAYRVVGYFEEEAVQSYTLYLPTSPHQPFPGTTVAWPKTPPCAMWCW